jgi:hypothetical protein
MSLIEIVARCLGFAFALGYFPKAVVPVSARLLFAVTVMIVCGVSFSLSANSFEQVLLNPQYIIFEASPFSYKSLCLHTISGIILGAAVSAGAYAGLFLGAWARLFLRVQTGSESSSEGFGRELQVLFSILVAISLIEGVGLDTVIERFSMLLLSEAKVGVSLLEMGRVLCRSVLDMAVASALIVALPWFLLGVIVDVVAVCMKRYKVPEFLKELHMSVKVLALICVIFLTVFSLVQTLSVVAEKSMGLGFQ